ncbi:hypothetical protein DPMN_019797 [Dreissena polymorpha]|uniref:Uncharacterized protein n=1 Tax=Dreissena polymorpha TaxID=45954 RepID=A0A9D4NLM5_DREPO|nr:hypothetical protein DPMN_019797 [Dreissena polymorpha]
MIKTDISCCCCDRAIARDCVSLDAKVTALNRECRTTLLLSQVHIIGEQHMEVSHVNR